MYDVFHWLAKKKNRHHINFEADLWPETGDLLFALLHGDAIWWINEGTSHKVRT